MRNVILAIFMAVACFAFIIAGHLYWESKVAEAVKEAQERVRADAGSEQAAKQANPILAQIKTLPADVQAAIKRAVEEKRPIRLVIAGSESTPENGGWPDLLKQALDKAYGKGVFHITVHEYEGLTTADADRQRIAADWANDEPDLVLLEPFLLNDNGVVMIDDTLAHIQSIIDELQSAAPDAAVILQPPNPIYNATYYPKQVEALERFAKDNGYAYFDHWSAWPDHKSEELNQYVDPESDLPTAEGANVWANALAKRFIAQ